MATLPEIAGYSDLVRVAKGGFGVVYRANQDRHGRVVALKVLNVDDLDERAQQRFERECVAMGSLSWHPNVVALLDSGMTVDGHPYLAMEYLDGGSFGDRLRGGPLPWQEAVVAGIQVAGALDVAHAAGTLHRDLKPENILVGPYGEAKLGDFGIAAVEGAARTTTGHASFTANHVAPEILRRQPPSERSDLYSLASTLHTLIAGSSPFEGGLDDPIEAVITSVLSEEAHKLDGIPDDLADLMVRTLAKDPGDRPESAEEFGRGLQHVQVDQGLPVTDLRLAPTTSTTAGAIDSLTNVEPVPPRQPVTGDPLPTIDHTPPEHPRGDPLPTLRHTSPTALPPGEHLPPSRPAPPRISRRGFAAGAFTALLGAVLVTSALVATS